MIPRIPYRITNTAPAFAFVRVPGETWCVTPDHHSWDVRPRVPPWYRRSPAPKRNVARSTATVAAMNTVSAAEIDREAALTSVRLTENMATRPTIISTLWISHEAAPAKMSAPPFSRLPRHNAAYASGVWAPGYAPSISIPLG